MLNAIYCPVQNLKFHITTMKCIQRYHPLNLKKKFQITQQGDAVAFLSWFLNALHLALGGTKKRNSSIIYKTFSGSMRIHTKKILPTDVDKAKKDELLATGEYEWRVEESPFLYLTAELPPPPLFKDDEYSNIELQDKYAARTCHRKSANLRGVLEGLPNSSTYRCQQ